MRALIKWFFIVWGVYIVGYAIYYLIFKFKVEDLYGPLLIFGFCVFIKFALSSDSSSQEDDEGHDDGDGDRFTRAGQRRNDRMHHRND